MQVIAVKVKLHKTMTIYFICVPTNHIKIQTKIDQSSQNLLFYWETLTVKMKHGESKKQKISDYRKAYKQNLCLYNNNTNTYMHSQEDHIQQ